MAARLRLRLGGSPLQGRRQGTPNGSHAEGREPRREVAADAPLVPEVCEAVGQPPVEAAVDRSRALLAGAPPEVLTRQLAPRPCHVHANDTDGTADRHWPLGRGILRLQPCVAARVDCHFAGTGGLEMDGPVEVLGPSRGLIEAARDRVAP